VSQHTSGPWKAGQRSPVSKDEMIAYVINCIELGEAGAFHLVTNEAGDADICHTGNGTASEANARLIAAAPELLAALTDLHSALALSLNAEDWPEPEMESARAAIRKATTP